MHCGDSFFNKLGASIGERTFCNATASKAFRMVAGPSGGVDPESFAEADVIIMWGINMLSTSMHHSRFVIEAMNKGRDICSYRSSAHAHCAACSSSYATKAGYRCCAGNGYRQFPD